MKIEYEYRFGLPRNIVWRYLKDENVLGNSLLGCKSFVESSTGVYQAELDINIGPIQDSFTLEIRREQEKPPLFYQLHVKGNGNLGEIDAKADLFIKEFQESAILISRIDTQVTGALALAGQRVLDAAAKKGLEACFQKMEMEIKRDLYKLKRGG
ncbi:SRPBCC domain-containing protein [Neobacillus soli]|uniref:SRPBCC domain-containing protein n=1 Tax=Neobacillus soli TaxID=220688 RepID=UPI000825D19B|nr:SRPBCC domain-containing protein [Neobacillus soli]